MFELWAALSRSGISEMLSLVTPVTGQCGQHPRPFEVVSGKVAHPRCEDARCRNEKVPRSLPTHD
jgi:hypothetical protein